VIFLSNRSKRGIRLFSIIGILVLVFSTIVFAKEYPAPTNEFYVNDFANVLDDRTESYIYSMNNALEKATDAQVVVVTVNDIQEQALEEFSLGLFREWGIGDAQKNNGVLILLDVAGKMSRIEVGYGLEGALPDGKTGRIQDKFMVPYFKEGDYNTGITEGFNAIINEVYLEYGYDAPIEGDYSTDSKPTNPLLMVIGIIFAIGLIILDFRFTGGMFTFMILRGIGRGGGGGSGRSGGGGSGGGGGSSRGW